MDPIRTESHHHVHVTRAEAVQITAAATRASLWARVRAVGAWFRWRAHRAWRWVVRGMMPTARRTKGFEGSEAWAEEEARRRVEGS